MGFLRKKFKQVKNAVKKVGKAVKKVVKKVTKSKLFKIIATVGAVLATGGAALGAFGGSFASSTLGQAIIKGGQFFSKFNPTSFKPFTATGKFLGSTLGKVTDFTGLTSEAGRMGYTFDPELGRYIAPDTIQAKDVGKIVDVKTGKTLELSELAAKTGEAAIKTADTGSKLARGTVLGDVTRGVVTNVGTGMLMTKLEGEPDTIGTPTGLSVTGENQLGDLAVAYSEANVGSLEDIYKTNYFGTADIGFNTDEPLFQQETLQIA